MRITLRLLQSTAFGAAAGILLAILTVMIQLAIAIATWWQWRRTHTRIARAS